MNNLPKIDRWFIADGAVAREGGYYVDGRYHEFESGDYLFDYETSTMWEVVE